MNKVTCPLCGHLLPGVNPAAWPWFPFCSEQCKLRDLGCWLSESYSLPAEEPDEPPFDSDDS